MRVRSPQSESTSESGVRAARAFVRGFSRRLREDRPLAGDIERVAGAIRDGSFVAAVEADAGALL